MAINQEKRFFEFKGAETTRLNPFQLYKSIDEIVNNKDMYMFLQNMSLDNRQYLKQEIGKQDFMTYDSACRRLHCYRINFNNGILWILTAREKGTSYEYLSTGNEIALREEIRIYLENLFKNREEPDGPSLM